MIESILNTNLTVHTHNNVYMIQTMYAVTPKRFILLYWLPGPSAMYTLNSFQFVQTGKSSKWLAHADPDLFTVLAYEFELITPNEQQ